MARSRRATGSGDTDATETRSLASERAGLHPRMEEEATDDHGCDTDFRITPT
jgi:hypothetical protein